MKRTNSKEQEDYAVNRGINTKKNICHNHLLPESHVALFIFGDSILDPGNNNYLSTILILKPPSGLTFTNSSTLVTAEFSGLPLIPEYLNPGNSKSTYGVNFATAGAGALVETHQGLKAERSLRKELGVAEIKKLLSDAVYFIDIGGNDYLTKTSTVTDEEFVSMVIGNLSAALKVRGRKCGFTNMMLMPLGCLPFFKAQTGGSCIDEVNALAKLHNLEFPKTLNKLMNQLDGFKYGYYDFFGSITERLNNPSKYGNVKPDLLYTPHYN
ncbi:putative GDSL lipase 1 [Hibiscus syriacus]|uniref:GDSL lipase 1 n=1 Tax=Hibiscus syriacus TaxID=106335 RepID=A0A6A2X037_HIBSY|nr:putative GDSL lipase 1 [Hibiscus syriacus]